MTPTMQKMAVPLTLASLLCHAATMVVLMQTRADLNTVQGAARGSHRHLLESAELDSFVTVAQLDALGARVAAVEQIAATATATADAWAGRGAEGAARSSSERSHGDARKVERRHDGSPTGSLRALARRRLRISRRGTRSQVRSQRRRPTGRC